jgi:tetrahydromethanopterin S-methyltransferase subunit B
LLPVPDPTERTVQQLLREIASLKEIVWTRLDAMDKAINLLQRTQDKSPTIAELNMKCEERFRSIDIQFKERDTRMAEDKRDNKVNIDTALEAQKEAVAEQNKSFTTATSKSEANFSKQLDSLNDKIEAKSLSDARAMTDLKDRVNRSEGVGAGKNALWGYIVAAGTVVLALLAIFALVRK